MKNRLLFICFAFIFMLSSCGGVPSQAMQAAKADAKNGGTQSREFTEREAVERVKAQSAYAYAGKRAEKKSALPAKIKAENATGEKVDYIILPEQEMDENSLLQLAAISFTNEQIAERQPLSDELQYEDAKAAILNGLKEYSFHTGNGCLIYPMYVPKQLKDKGGIWSAMVQCEGTNDYKVSINAKTGRIMSVFRRAAGEYSGEPLPKLEMPETDFSNEEILNAAAQFYKAHGFTTASVSEVNPEVQDFKATGFAYCKQVNFSNDKEAVSLFIDLADLSVCGIIHSPKGEK